MEVGGNFEILQHYQEIYEWRITTTKVDDTPLTNISFYPHDFNPHTCRHLT